MSERVQTDVFLTHDWGKDELGRVNHDRVALVNARLKELGYSTWFDSDKMTGDIVGQMAEGIENTRLVLVFVTQRYQDKVGGKNEGDNCMMEFKYALRSKTKALMIAIVMEERMSNPSRWTGPVGLGLGGELAVRMSFDFSDEAKFTAAMADLKKEIDVRLKKLPAGVPEKSPGTVTTPSSSAATTTVQPPPVPPRSTETSRTTTVIDHKEWVELRVRPRNTGTVTTPSCSAATTPIPPRNTGTATTPSCSAATTPIPPRNTGTATTSSSSAATTPIPPRNTGTATTASSSAATTPIPPRNTGTATTKFTAAMSELKQGINIRLKKLRAGVPERSPGTGRTTTVWDMKEWSKLRDSCKTLKDITRRVEDKRINNMFVVMRLLTWVTHLNSPTTEEAEVFVNRLENISQDNPLKTISPLYIDSIISALKLSPRQGKVQSIALLEKIKNNPTFISLHDNVILSVTADKVITVKLSTGYMWKYPFEFKHPGTPAECHMSGKCGFIIKASKQGGYWKYELCTQDTEYNDTGLHLHEIVSTEEMYYYEIRSGTTQEGNTVLIPDIVRRRSWFPNVSNWEYVQDCVSYNVSSYLVAKQD